MHIEKAGMDAVKIWGDKMTNADKIRSMTDKELAEWLDEHDDQWDFCHNKCHYFDGMDCTKSAQSCKDGRLEWLKQEAGNE